MTITMTEAVGSQKTVIDLGNTQLTLQYNVSGSSSREEIVQHVVANIPASQTVNGLLLGQKKVSDLSNKGSSTEDWSCTVVYNHVSFRGDLPTNNPQE